MTPPDVADVAALLDPVAPALAAGLRELAGSDPESAAALARLAPGWLRDWEAARVADRARWGWCPSTPPTPVGGPAPPPRSGYWWLGVRGKAGAYPDMGWCAGAVRPDGAAYWTTPGAAGWTRFGG